MNERSALLAAIRDNPDDHALRLIYADWLEEHDEPERAEVIRIEVEATSLSSGDPRKDELGKRARALWEAHRSDWLGPGSEELDATTSGGFVEEINGLATGFLQHGEEWFRREPLIRSAYLFECDEVAEELRQWKGLGGIAELALSFEEEETAAVVLANPDLQGVRKLYLCEAPIGLSGLQTLTNNRSLANLEDLDLDECGIGAGGGRILQAATHLTQLRALRMGGDDLGNEDLAALANAPHLGNLAELFLDSTDIGDAGLIALAHSPYLVNLTTFRLTQTMIGDEGVSILARSSLRDGLLDLSLGSQGLTHIGVDAIANSAYLHRLGSLTFYNSPLGLEGAEALARSRGLLNLTSLACHWVAFGSRAARVLAQWPGLPRLETLSLVGNPLKNQGLIRFVELCPELPALQALELSNCRLGNEAMMALAGCSKFPSLQRLSLSGNNSIGAEGGQALLSSPYFDRLTNLSLYDTGIPEGVKAELRKRFG